MRNRRENHTWDILTMVLFDAFVGIELCRNTGAIVTSLAVETLI